MDNTNSNNTDSKPEKKPEEVSENPECVNRLSFLVFTDIEYHFIGQGRNLHQFLLVSCNYVFLFAELMNSC